MLVVLSINKAGVVAKSEARRRATALAASDEKEEAWEKELLLLRKKKSLLAVASSLQYSLNIPSFEFRALGNVAHLHGSEEAF